MNESRDVFAEGQWWLAELDQMVANGTHDQKRAVAVVRNLVRQHNAALAPVAPGEPVARIIEGTEVDQDGNLLAAREIDWCAKDIDNLPVGTNLYPDLQPAPVAQPLMDEQIDKAARTLAAAMDYPWEHMPAKGRDEMRKHARAVIEAATGQEGGEK
jgi:hypothetical protein